MDASVVVWLIYIYILKECISWIYRPCVTAQISLEEMNNRKIRFV
jgi:hypothetical protein